VKTQRSENRVQPAETSKEGSKRAVLPMMMMMMMMMKMTTTTTTTTTILT
jgi:hypothetical protein